MIKRTAKTSLSIRIVTTIIIAMVVGFLIGGLFNRNLLIGGMALGIIAFFCYLFAPTAYDISDGRLTVLLHAGKKCFGPIVSCTLITERFPFTIRLFGNGGLFAGTGIFWNKRHGIFGIYATSAKRTDMVLVQTKNYKVLVTPEDPQVFVESTRTLELVNPSYSEPHARSPQG